MINFNVAKSFCREDLKLIENYDKALADDKETWVLHHKNAEPFTGFSKNDLIKMNMYYHRPASELKFLTRAEHAKVHKPRAKSDTSAEGRKNISKAQLKRYENQDERLKCGHKFKGRTWKKINGKRVWMEVENA